MSPFEQQVEAALLPALLRSQLAPENDLRTLAAMIALPVAAALEAAHADGVADELGRSRGLEETVLPILREETSV